MSRINNSAKWAAVTAFVFLAAAFASGEVLLDDDFTDAAASHLKWMNTSEDMTVTVGGGSCALSNPSQYFGDYIHTFGAPKPATFTITYTLKSQTGGAGGSGVLFCKQPDTYNGYFLTVEDNELVVYKMVQSGNGVSWDPVYYEESFDIDPQNNEITVSKSGSRIVLFANGAYVGEFTDNTYDSGDLALFLAGGTGAVFGPVLVTDVFTDGRQRTSFSDDFGSGELKYWQYPNAAMPRAAVQSGRLVMNPGEGEATLMYVDIDVSDFSAKVEVSHVSGVTGQPYGIVLVGERVGNSPIQTVNFSITGDRKYGVWNSSNSEYTPVLNSAIKGSAGQLGVVYIDTLELRKMPGANNYEFLVNGTPLLSDYPAANFKVVSFGLFCYSAQTVAFDNFEVKNEGTSAVRFGGNRPAARGSAAKKIAIVRNSVNLKVDNRATVRIFGLNGRELRKVDLARGEHSVRLGNLPKGMYMARVAVDGEKATLRVPVR